MLRRNFLKTVGLGVLCGGAVVKAVCKPTGTSDAVAILRKRYARKADKCKSCGSTSWTEGMTFIGGFGSFTPYWRKSFDELGSLKRTCNQCDRRELFYSREEGLLPEWHFDEMDDAHREFEATNAKGLYKPVLVVGGIFHGEIRDNIESLRHCVLHTAIGGPTLRYSLDCPWDGFSLKKESYGSTAYANLASDVVGEKRSDMWCGAHIKANDADHSAYQRWYNYWNPPKSEPVLFVGGPWHGQIREWRIPERTRTKPIQRCGYLDKCKGPWDPCPADCSPGGTPYIRLPSNPAYALEERIVKDGRALSHAVLLEHMANVHAEDFSPESHEKWVLHWHPSVERWGTFKGVPLYMDKPTA